MSDPPGKDTEKIVSSPVPDVQVANQQATKNLHADSGTGPPVITPATINSRAESTIGTREGPQFFDTAEPPVAKPNQVSRGDNTSLVTSKPADGKNSDPTPLVNSTVFGDIGKNRLGEGKPVVLPAKPISDTTASASSIMQTVKAVPQGGDAGNSGSVRSTEGRISPPEVKSVPPTTDAKASPVATSSELKVPPAVTDGVPATRTATAHTGESSSQDKNVLQRAFSTNSDNAVGNRGDSATAALGSTNVPREAVTTNTANRPAVVESATGIVTGNAGRPDVKAEGKGLPEASTTAGVQLRGDSKVEPSLSLPPSAQNKLDTQKVEPQPAGPGNLPRNSDVFSTQGTSNPTAKVEGARVSEARLDTGKPVEQPGSKDASTFRDPKSTGVASEVFGQKTDSGSRGDSQSGGIKPDASAGQKAEQITRGIENRVNEGVKQPSTADGRIQTSNESNIGGRQPGTADGASSTTRQPLAETGGKSQGITDGAQPGVKQTNPVDNVGSTVRQPTGSDGVSPPGSSNIRQPMADAGDKGSSGGGSSAAADSTKKFDSGITQGGKSEGQSGSSGMGGGSSAPIDRAPHAPFRVEDGQPSGVKGEGGIKGDLGAKGDAPIGGKGESAVSGGKVAGDGSRFDTGEVRGNQPGTRFDSGEVRGTQPGTRFDAGEIKDTRGGIPTGGKSGGTDTTGGSDSSIVKGTDVSGTKAVGAAFLPPGRKDEAVPA